MYVRYFIERLCDDIGRTIPEVTLYARRLREAGLFHDRTDLRNIEIEAEYAANLVLSLMAAPHALQAAEAVRSYGSLPVIQTKRLWLRQNTLDHFLISAFAGKIPDDNLDSIEQLIVLHRQPLAILRTSGGMVVFGRMPAAKPEMLSSTSMSGRQIRRLSVIISISEKRAAALEEK